MLPKVEKNRVQFASEIMLICECGSFMCSEDPREGKRSVGFYVWDSLMVEEGFSEIEVLEFYTGFVCSSLE